VVKLCFVPMKENLYICLTKQKMCQEDNWVSIFNIFEYEQEKDSILIFVLQLTKYLYNIIFISFSVINLFIIIKNSRSKTIEKV
jgi:hypothetical protein